MTTTVNPNTIIWAVVIIFVTGIGAMVGFAFAVPDGARLETIMTIVFTNVASIAGVLLLLIRSDRTEKKIDEITDNTNGKLDKRIAEGVHSAIAALQQGTRPDSPDSTVIKPLPATD